MKKDVKRSDEKSGIRTHEDFSTWIHTSRTSVSLKKAWVMRHNRSATFPFNLSLFIIQLL